MAEYVFAAGTDYTLYSGAAAETFIDNVSRKVFDSFAEFEALYGVVPEMVELPYPRAMSARQVPHNFRKRMVRKWDSNENLTQTRRTLRAG